MKSVSEAVVNNTIKPTIEEFNNMAKNFKFDTSQVKLSEAALNSCLKSSDGSHGSVVQLGLWLNVLSTNLKSLIEEVRKLDINSMELTFGWEMRDVEGDE